MFKSKELKKLEARVSALEKDLKALFSAPLPSPQPNDRKISYEEVINEWLCGKETN